MDAYSQFIDTAPIPAPNFPGKMVVARLIWERDQWALVINLRTAKTLGLTVSPTLLARADEVIE